MKKVLISATAVLALATVAWVQVNQSAPRELASLMPAGPLIYLEAKDFHSVLSEWNQSGVKQNWLASKNYSVFSNSNLLQKLEGLYQEYGNVSGLLPGLSGTLEIAGHESALGLYEFTEQQFVYITKVDHSQLDASQLWRLREKFTIRQANGISFYLRCDDASRRTVAFAYINGWLVVSTDSQLMANTLALIAGQNAQSLAGSPWYKRALTHVAAPGELRMALNMQALIGDVHFRSYWIQRNVSELRPFESEVADVLRTPNEINETRSLVRLPEQPADVPSPQSLEAAAALRSIAPADAALSITWAEPRTVMIESRIESKLLMPAGGKQSSERYAPQAVPTDGTAGTEQDLETRIDEPALTSEVGGKLESEQLRRLIQAASPNALLQVETTVTSNGFIRAPVVLVVSSTAGWDANAVRTALTSAVETLWSTSQLGVGWRTATAGSRSIEQLDGLAALQFAINGKLLYLANDSAILTAMLNQAAATPVASGPAFAAEFHHSRERGDYLTVMRALDFGGHSQEFLFEPQGARTPQFFSENVASLSSVLSFIHSMSITRTVNQDAELQRVVYR